MPDPTDLLHHPSRLAAVAGTGLAGTPPEEAFDRITRLATRVLGAPVSMLSLLDGENQWAKSVCGASVPRPIPAERSICRLVVAENAPVLLDDVRAEPRVAEDAEMLRWGVRAYAGVPLVTAEGHALGALCVAAPEPRAWPEQTVPVLRDLAAIALGEIEWRRAQAERDRAAQALAGAEELFRALVEQSLVGIYVVQDGVFRYVNPRFYEIFGYPEGWLDEPRPFLDVVDEADHEMVSENIRRRVDGEVRGVHYRFRGRHHDGSRLYLEVHGTRTEIRGRPAIIGVGIDVTQRVRAEREREEAVLARDRFYAMMSHELRTPVSAVMLYNDLLLSDVYDPLSEGQREAVDRAQKSARHLLDLINDLLDLAKLEAGKLEARLEDVDVAALAEGVVAGMRPLAAEHGCTLVLSCDARPLSATADALRVRQILINLVSNAMKFGHGRPVEVRCRDEAGGAVVEVADQGPGIAPADLERIFEEFVQLGEPGVGTGLGLPVARRLAELQGGSLHVRSTMGEGTVFRLQLTRTVPPVAHSTGFPPSESSDILR